MVVFFVHEDELEVCPLSSCFHELFWNCFTGTVPLFFHFLISTFQTWSCKILLLSQELEGRHHIRAFVLSMEQNPVCDQPSSVKTLKAEGSFMSQQKFYIKKWKVSTSQLWNCFGLRKHMLPTFISMNKLPSCFCFFIHAWKINSNFSMNNIFPYSNFCYAITYAKTWKYNSNPQHLSISIHSLVQRQRYHTCTRHKAEWMTLFLCNCLNIDTQSFGLCYSSVWGSEWSSVTKTWRSAQTVLDFPAWPVNPSHHAPHRVSPQDGDVQVLASVIDDLAALVSSPFVEGQSTVERAQVPPQAWISDDDYPRRPGFARRSQIHLAKAVFRHLVTQQRGESILLQGAVFSLAHG